MTRPADGVTRPVSRGTPCHGGQCGRRRLLRLPVHRAVVVTQASGWLKGAGFLLFWDGCSCEPSTLHFHCAPCCFSFGKGNREYIANSELPCRIHIFVCCLIFFEPHASPSPKTKKRSQTTNAMPLRYNFARTPNIHHKSQWPEFSSANFSGWKLATRVDPLTSGGVQLFWFFPLGCPPGLPRTVPAEVGTFLHVCSSAVCRPCWPSSFQFSSTASRIYIFNEGLLSYDLCVLSPQHR